MESNISISQNKEGIAKQLFAKGYLPGPNFCKYRGRNILINHDTYNK